MPDAAPGPEGRPVARRRTRLLSGCAVLGALVAAGLVLGPGGCRTVEPPAAWAEPRDHWGELTVDGRARSFLVHVPPGWTAGEAVPLVLVLHGGGGQAAKTPKFTRFSGVADREGFVVVYPQGYERRWNDGRFVAGHATRELDLDDVGFLVGVVDAVTAALGTDPARVYACGISNGGMMSLRLACDAAERFAAVGAVVASLPADLHAEVAADPERPSGPIPVLLMAGTEDALVPYDGGQVRFRETRLGEVLSVPEAARFFAAHNGCAPEPEVEALPDRAPDDGTRILVERYPGSAEVVVYQVVGGGHTWSGAGGVFQDVVPVVGRESEELATHEVLWDFFARQAREPVADDGG